MSLLDAILGAGGGVAVQQLGSQFGLDQNQTTSALAALVPALAGGLHQNAQNAGGLADLLGALTTGGHQKYVDNPVTLTDPAAVEDGNKILGHVLGSKDASRQIASHAAAQTGVGVDVMKKMLPMAATLVMGALASHAAPAGAPPGATTSPPSASTPDLMSLLSSSPQSTPQQSVLGILGGFLSR